MCAGSTYVHACPEQMLVCDHKLDMQMNMFMSVNKGHHSYCLHCEKLILMHLLMVIYTMRINWTTLPCAVLFLYIFNLKN